MRIAICLAVLLLATACGPEPAAEQGTTPDAAATELAAATPAPSATPSRPKGPFAPRDECGRLAGAGDFRARLIEAVRLRDADALVALADPGIKLDFGGGGGIAELRQRLAAGPELWQALDDLLGLGCAVNSEGGLTMPWLFDQDIGDAEPYAAMLVMGEDVPVMAGPGPSAPQIAAISWDLVEAVSYSPEQPLSEVKLSDGRTGFVATDKLRAVIDYRLLAHRVGGRWKIEALIAGD